MLTLPRYQEQPARQRLARAVAALEDAETERDAAIAEALIAGCPANEVATVTGLTTTRVQEIAQEWGYRVPA